LYPQSTFRENFTAVLGKALPRVHTRKHGTTRNFVVFGVVSTPITPERLRSRVYPSRVYPARGFHLGWFPIDKHRFHVKVSVAVEQVPLSVLLLFFFKGKFKTSYGGWVRSLKATCRMPSSLLIGILFKLQLMVYQRSYGKLSFLECPNTLSDK